MGTKPSISAFMAIPEIGRSIASPAGTHIAFFLERGDDESLRLLDVSQNEIVEVDARSPKPNSLNWSADGTRLFFQEATDSDQIIVHTAALDGTTRECSAIDSGGELWDVHPDGTSIYYRTETALCRYDIESEAETALVRETSPIRLPIGGCSPDGTQIAYTVSPEDTDEHHAYVASAAGGSPQRLEFGDTDDTVIVKAWHPDNRRLLVADHPSHGHCGVYDLEEHTVRWFGCDVKNTLPPYLPGPEMPVTFLPDGNRFLARRVVQTASRPIIYDLNGSARTLPIDGQIEFRRATTTGALLGDNLLIRRETETKPGDLVRYDVATDEWEHIFELGTGDVTPVQIVEPRSVQYETASGESAPGVVYDSGERPSPAVVYVYGYRAGVSPQFRREIQYLVSEGYTVFLPVHPSDPFSTAEHANHAAAGRWLKEHDWVDEERVAVMGHSHGGYDVCMQMVRFPEVWAAGMAISGYTDLLAFNDAWHDMGFVEVYLGDPNENAEMWQDQSPVIAAEQIKTTPSWSLLTIYPENDYIPADQLQEFREALLDRGVTREQLEHVELAEQGHSPRTQRQRCRQWKTVTEFLRHHL